jgi:hypothetical protein
MKRLNSSLPAFLKKYALKEGSLLGQIQAVWPSIVGDYLATQLQPIQFQQGILLCYSPSSALMQEVTYLEGQILTKLKTYPWAREIRALRLTVQAPVPVAQQQQGQERMRDALTERSKSFHLEAKPVRVSLRTEQAMQAAVQVIGDNEAQKRVLRFFRAVEKRRQTLLANDWKACPVCGNLTEPGMRCLQCQKKSL